VIADRLVRAVRSTLLGSRSWRGPLAVLLLGAATPGTAQRVITQPSQVVSVSKGASALLVNTTAIQRFSVGEPTIAEAIVLSPTEVLINGKSLGTTTLFIWDNSYQVKVYSVRSLRMRRRSSATCAAPCPRRTSRSRRAATR
jgi:Flp pilus assembly secretin CpaC